MEDWVSRYLREFEKEFKRIREEISRIEEEMLRPLYDLEHGAVEPLHESEWRGNELILRVDLAGVKNKEDISLTVVDGKLVLEARLEKPFTAGDITLLRGKSITEYRLELALPPGAVEDAIKARFRNGILEIRIPVETHRVKVKVE